MDHKNDFLLSGLPLIIIRVCLWSAPVSLTRAERSESCFCVFLSSTVRLKTQTHADVILPAHTHHARLSGWNVTPELLSEVSRSKTPAIFLQLLQDTLCLGSVTESVAITSIQAYKFLAS